jgi:hypothetical protein
MTLTRTSEGGLQVYLARLRELPFVRAARVVALSRTPDLGADADIEIKTPTGAVRLHAELKTSHLGAETAARLLVAQREAPSWILFAPYIGAPLGEQLEAKRINFADRQGNCFLQVGNQYIARIQGRPPPKSSPRAKGLRGPGFQVLFALLAEPELLSESMRVVAKAAGVSVQPVADLLARLRDEGHLIRRGRAHAWVDGHRAQLLDRWLTGYSSNVRPKLYVGRFRLPAHGPQEVEQLVSANLDGVRFGGTAAAFRLDRYYHGPDTVIHLDPSETARKKLKASRSDTGDLVWLRPMGEVSNRGEAPDTVHPLLVYSELIVDRDPRAHEAATRLRQKWLPWSL